MAYQAPPHLLQDVGAVSSCMARHNTEPLATLKFSAETRPSTRCVGEIAVANGSRVSEIYAAFRDYGVMLGSQAAPYS
jgi:hypothetical protein